MRHPNFHLCYAQSNRCKKEGMEEEEKKFITERFCLGFRLILVFLDVGGPSEREKIVVDAGEKTKLWK